MEIPAPLLDELIRFARLEWPNEACGLLAGPPDHRGPVDLWKMRNIADHPRFRYAMDEQEQLAAWRAIEAGGHRVHAIFHSHTIDGAEPSPEDLRYALDPDVWHLIVGLHEPGGTPQTKLWRVVDGSGIEQPFTVVP